jgi:hypothetical protein
MVQCPVRQAQIELDGDNLDVCDLHLAPPCPSVFSGMKVARAELGMRPYS